MICDICGVETPRIYRKAWDNGTYCRRCIKANPKAMRPIKVPKVE